MRTSYLNQARAYYRVAAKFGRAGNVRMAEHYRKVAEMRMKQHRAHVEFMERAKKSR